MKKSIQALLLTFIMKQYTWLLWVFAIINFSAGVYFLDLLVRKGFNIAILYCVCYFCYFSASSLIDISNN